MPRGVYKRKSNDKIVRKPVGAYSVNRTKPKVSEDVAIGSLEEFKRAMAHMQEHDRLPDDTCPADLYDAAVAAIEALS